MIYVFLADGFEECEAVGPIDMLRRAGCDVVTVKIGGSKGGSSGSKEEEKVMGSHDIEITADLHERNIGLNGLAELKMIVLPGGAAGVENLYKSEIVKNIIDYCIEHKIPVGAICAAPSILARMGYLKNIKATAYPSFRHYLKDGGAVVEEVEKVVTDSIFTTAAAAGVSIEFGLELVKVLKGEAEAKKIGEQILI